MEASTLLSALPVGLQLWDADPADPDRPALRWASEQPGPDALRVGREAARAALAGEPVDGTLAGDEDRWFRVRARPAGAGAVVVSFQEISDPGGLDARILAGLQDGLIVISADERVMRANQAAAELCGISLGELCGASLSDLPVELLDADGDPLDPADWPARRALAGEKLRNHEVQVLRRDGTRVRVEMAASRLAEADGRPYGVLTTWKDVTERSERERRIRHEADTDELTGLPNRRALGRMLDAALARAEAHRAGVGVLLLDLDGFKAVNDSYGHQTGDAALREVAVRLRASVRERDVVARTGGDEFVVVLPDLGPADARVAQECAARLETALRPPVALGPAAPQLRAAVGIARFPADGDDGETLLAAADRAMYARKAQ